MRIVFELALALALSGLAASQTPPAGVVVCSPACAVWQVKVIVAPGTTLGSAVLADGVLSIQVPAPSTPDIGVPCVPADPNAYELFAEIGNGRCLRLRQFNSAGQAVAWATNVLGAPSQPWDVVFWTNGGKPPRSRDDLWATWFQVWPKRAATRSGQAR